MNNHQENTNQNTTFAAAMHLSVFSKYFIPFGNFIFPMLLWLGRKEDPFIDRHGRNALNFQISTFLYMVLIICLGIFAALFFGFKFSHNDSFYFNQDHVRFDEFSAAFPFIMVMIIVGLLLFGLFVLELFAVINAAIKASDGEDYKFPITINFLGSPDKKLNSEENKYDSNVESI
ncbi:DUF4870 domain-containing protein [Gramella sp. AN32]|uniref:DUF4870 domain-containing protein n=1 Tax=Christiangramia antarctica TaxID=2058158 RepID=A0ABW5XCU9_9FLAO|nr:DUF4870 domain-containing protein [Gramella sp. AN32]